MSSARSSCRGIPAALAGMAVLACVARGAEGVRVQFWQLDGDQMVLRIPTEVDRRYRVEASTNLVDWSTERVTVPVDGPLANLFLPAPAVDSRFYRVSVFDHEELRAELSAARERWAGRGWTDYSFEMRWSCHCPFQDWVRVVVVESRVVDVRSVGTGESLPEDEWGNAATVDALFDQIQSRLDLPAVEVRAEFDPEAGYPLSVFSDISILIADDETGVEVRAMQP